ncbi:TonB family protein [Stenotrophomonas sp. Marseille-Q5258]|uniref:energy transducer TonB family protein n=1 Tax=Stenotrophomonas sp. Marseille-Q5258 TaxID=2972779 RepID=UPI0021C8BCAF|nr:TonB family protein [Stenotrophomonas sp. Marseille-Q5258]
MKVIAILIIAMVVFIGLSPFWGWSGALVYGAIAWLGHLLATGPLGDGRAAFRTAVLLGGTVSVLSFLRVAWQDRALSYLLAGGGLGFVFFLIFFATGLSPERAARNAAPVERAEDAPEQHGRVPHWYSRAHFEREMVAKVQETARAAARGDRQGADALLEELHRWARNPPRVAEDAAAYERLRLAYNDTVEALGKLNVGGRDARGRRVPAPAPDPASAEQIQTLEARQVELLEQMWDQSASNINVPLRLMAIDLRTLAVSRWLGRDAAVDAESDAAMERRLWRVHALQEVLFAYAPMDRRLWEAYAATVLDKDEELSLGALVIAGMLEGRERMVGADAGAFDVNTLMLGSDVLTMSTLAGSGSSTRRDILASRAALLIGTPAADPAPAQGPDAVPRAERVIEVPTGRTPRHDVHAERAMPPAGLLIERTGLALRPPPEPPAPMPRRDRGEVQVDLAAAGFKVTPPGIPLRPPGIVTDTRAVLVLDVWENGQVTSVLIETGSGNPDLDQAARYGARGWRSATKVPKGGERRRVEVVFRAPVTVQAPPPAEDVAPFPVGTTPPPPKLNPAQSLGAQLSAQARRHPPRYPTMQGGERPDGRVVVMLRMSAGGRVLDARVAESSGHPELDRAALQAARGWHVTPTRAVTDVDEITLRIPVTFNTGI